MGENCKQAVLDVTLWFVLSSSDQRRSVCGAVAPILEEYLGRPCFHRLVLPIGLGVEHFYVMSVSIAPFLAHAWLSVKGV